MSHALSLPQNSVHENKVQALYGWHLHQDQLRLGPSSHDSFTEKSLVPYEHMTQIPAPKATVPSKPTQGI
jgi:hypothetical protein